MNETDLTDLSAFRNNIDAILSLVFLALVIVPPTIFLPELWFSKPGPLATKIMTRYLYVSAFILLIFLWLVLCQSWEG